MCKRVYLKAKEAEKEMQEARNENGFVGKNEELLVSNMIKMARKATAICKLEEAKQFGEILVAL